MSPNVSIKDIAHAAGVSHTTVSRALRNSPLISAEVREQIQKLAQEMGYAPNRIAQSLKSNRTNTIGLVITSLADPFMGRVVRGIEAVARQYHHSVLLCTSNNDPQHELDGVETFRQRQVDGVIYAAAQVSPQYEDQLVRLKIPTLLINHTATTPQEHIRSVRVDDYAGACKAVEFLLQLGHQRIGYIGAGNRPRSNEMRMQAYHNTLRAAGIVPQVEWVRLASAQHRYPDDDACGGQTLTPSLLSTGVTAIFCYNDMTAVGALMACRNLGIAVPDQLSIMGFDDIELAQYVTPALSTIHQPQLQMGQLAMKMMLDLLAGRTVYDRLLPTELVPRNSTARLAGEVK